MTFNARRIAASLILIVSAMAIGQTRLAAADDQSLAIEKDPAKLIAVLRSDAPPQDKALVCKRLAVFGGQEAVPALAPLLTDAQLSSWARIALEAIPGPAADQALRQAMGKLKGRLLIGVINSIGFRRDAKAVGALVARLKDADAEVVSAAAAALGRIANAPAAAALQAALNAGPTAARAAAAQGCILCADRLLTEKKLAEAGKLYDLIRKADVPKQRILEATRGAILARGSAGVPLLVEQLQSADKSFFGLGLWTARELPGREVTEALVAELGRASPERRPLLVLALADRGDAAAFAPLLQAAKSGPENVRIAAVRVLGRLGGAACLPVLLDAAQDDSADLGQAALDALADLAGKEVDGAVAARFAKAEGKGRLVLIQLAGRRRIQAVVPALLKAADDPEAQTRAAALAALGQTIDLGQLSVLISRVANPRDADESKAAEDALLAACARMPDREACAAKLVEAMAQVPTAAKCKFLEVLTAMGGVKALQTVAAAAKDADPEIRDAGSRLLGEWMTADVAPVLLDLAKTSAEAKYKIRALRGYLRIARQLNLPLAQRTAMAREALKIAQRNDEKKLVLEVLRRYPSAEGLAMVLPHLRTPGLKAPAALAAVMIGDKLLPKHQAAVADAMKQVLESRVSGDVANRAKAILDRAR